MSRRSGDRISDRLQRVRKQYSASSEYTFRTLGILELEEKLGDKYVGVGHNLFVGPRCGDRPIPAVSQGIHGQEQRAHSI